MRPRRDGTSAPKGKPTGLSPTAAPATPNQFPTSPGGPARYRSPIGWFVQLRREEQPAPRYPPEFVLTPIFEDQIRSENEVLDRARYEDLAGCGLARDPGCNVNSNAADVITTYLNFTSVNSGAQAHPLGRECVADGCCTIDGSRWAIERR